jgi:biotin operon repressor
MRSQPVVAGWCSQHPGAKWKRLTKAGWLNRVRTGGYQLEDFERLGSSTTWRLVRPRRLRLLQNAPINEAGSLNGAPCNNADVWRRGGLGQTAYRVWQALDVERPVTAADVARQTGCHRSTVGRTLAALERSGYAIRSGRQWWRTAAEPALTYARLQAQQLGHAVERERFEETKQFLRRRRAEGGNRAMKPKVSWLLVNVGTAHAIKVAAFLIVANRLRPSRLVMVDQHTAREAA